MVLSGNCAANIVKTDFRRVKIHNLVYYVGGHSPSLNCIDECQALDMF